MSSLSRSSRRPAFIGARRALAALALASITIGAPCLAQTNVLNTPTPWMSLSSAQREALAPLERDWPRIDAGRQKKWLDVAGRFEKLPVDERERVQQRMADWSRMSPDERSRARLNFQELRSASAPDELQSRWQTYQALPDSQKNELAKRASTPSAQTAPPVKPVRVDGTKSAVVKSPNPQLMRSTPVTPMLVQSAPGATTNLVSQPAKPPMHQQAGLPKMTAKPGFVDQKTLIPKRGMQGAAIAAQAEPFNPVQRQ